MSALSRALAALFLLVPPFAGSLAAQDISPLPPATSQPVAGPQFAQPDDPWIYRGTDIPIDREWLMGELPNGVRYAVRNNGVPPGQVSMRVAIDAGSLYERDDEQGYAHLIEHLIFRQSRYFGDGEAIPHFQRWGASLGHDTNATTSPTQTVYKLDLPNAQPQRLEESVRLFAGMIQEPTLSADNVATELPIVLAERRDMAGVGLRIADASREVFFSGQPLASRSPIGPVATLKNADAQGVQAFHRRWYRPQNTVVVLVGDADAKMLATLVERYFGDWTVAGEPTPEPDFGAPIAPVDAPADRPVGETRVIVEPGQPRALTYAYLRPFEQVVDNLEYNRGILINTVALSIINRRLESRARAGGNYLYAGVNRERPSRSSDGTYITFAPLTQDWQSALSDVRATIADALATPPSEAEIAQAIAQIDIAFVDMVGQAEIQAGSSLADDLVNAVDIREAVAAPETFLSVFREMRSRFTPDAILEHTKALFDGDVIRAILLVPEPGEAEPAALRQALLAPVTGAGEAREETAKLDFADLPPIGTPAPAIMRERLGFRDVDKLTYANGVRALVWRTDNEPGRVTVRVRFGDGRQAFAPDEGTYAWLGQMALINSGLGSLDQDDLDRLASGRKLSFDFAVEDGSFRFEGLTRAEDVADQLYLFAAKLAQPRWDAAPVERAKASGMLAYESYASNPIGVVNRDLDWLLRDQDPRFATPAPEALQAASPDQFRDVWSRVLAEGPVEVAVFGDINPAATISALDRTFGALPPRPDLAQAAAGEAPRISFPPPSETAQVLAHSGDKDQAAAVIAWPTGGGTQDIARARKLELLAQVFGNRLLDALRERAGAAYSPFVASNWPQDIDKGGAILALAQVQPVHIPGFFIEAEQIAADLAATGPTADELARVIEPVRQMLARAQTGHTFWLNQLDGGAFNPAIVAAAQPGTLWRDYVDTTAAELQALATTYLTGRGGFKVAVLPASLAGQADELFATGTALGRR